MGDTRGDESPAGFPYNTRLNILHQPLEIIDVPALVRACRDQWYNQTLCQVDEAVVRLGVVQGEYHWHHHDNEDEFFYVVSGRFLIDLEDRTARSHSGKRFRGAQRREASAARAEANRNPDGRALRDCANRRELNLARVAATRLLVRPFLLLGCFQPRSQFREPFLRERDLRVVCLQRRERTALRFNARPRRVRARLQPFGLF